MAHFSFDISSVADRGSSYELLPLGWYTAQISNSDMVALKSGNGEGLKLTFDIIEGQHRGRKVWVTLNVRHTDADTARRGQRDLGRIMDSIGVARFEDSIDLHNKPLQIKVKVRTDTTGRYEDQNEVAGYRSVSAGAPTQSAIPVARPVAPAATPAANATTPPSAVPPWQKRAA